jgi:tRNA(Ile)-lysidine synthase
MSVPAATRLDPDALFAPLADARGLLLAVSGGPDSMALLRLAAAWRANGATPPLHVATVDHKLRPESGAEARHVERWAAEVGLPHDTLVWDGPKPETRLQEAARAARYELLCVRATALGLDHIVTAHHADDQAETVLFRLLRGSGVAGLAGMSALAPWGALTIARPLLAVSKADLVSYCASLDQPFVEDPSNADPAYARTRMRRLSARLTRIGLDRTALLRLAQRAARLDAALAPQLAAAVPSLAIERHAEGLDLDAAPLAALPEEVALRLLKQEIGALRPERPVRLDRLERLTSDLRAAIAARRPHAATLGGVLLRLERGGRLSLRREAARRRGRLLSFDGTAL